MKFHKFMFIVLIICLSLQNVYSQQIAQNAKFPMSITDGKEGAILAWTDTETNYVYAKFLRSDEKISEKILLSKDSILSDISTDGNGGAIISLSKKDRIDFIFLKSDGTISPTSPYFIGTGITKPLTAYDTKNKNIIALFQYKPENSNDPTIYALFIKDELIFGTKQVPITTSGLDAKIVPSDNGGFIITFLNSKTNGIETVYIDENLKIINQLPIPIDINPNNNYLPFNRKMKSNKQGGYILAWPDFINTKEAILASEIDSTGTTSETSIISQKIGPFANEPVIIPYDMNIIEESGAFTGIIFALVCGPPKCIQGIYTGIVDVANFFDDTPLKKTNFIESDISPKGGSPPSITPDTNGNSFIFYINNKNLYVESIDKDGNLKSGVKFVRGDTNNDKIVDISDAITILNYLFNSGVEPSCLDSADIDDNGLIDLSDAIYLINRLFLAGPPIPDPTEMGQDPTPDAIKCI